MKTQEEIQQLKDSWNADPCWDLSETEGFEDHVDELKAHEEEMKKVWANNRRNRNARFISQMKSIYQGEKISTRIGNILADFIRVPGGWVYREETDSGAVTSCFIPYCE